ncbi:MAG: hypothetical protein ACK4YV_11300 [Emticicia sp.]
MLQIQRVGGTSVAEISQIIADTPIETFNDSGTVFRASERFLKKIDWCKSKIF